MVGRLRRVVQPPNVVRKHYLLKQTQERLEEGISKRKALGGFAIHATHQRVAGEAARRKCSFLRSI